MRHRPSFGPRGLVCQAALRREKRVMDPVTKLAGRCGECKACWRLFVHVLRAQGRPMPRARRDGSIAGFVFVRRGG
ncbi:MAG TPA: hypothetical protein VNC22_08385 [Sporichthya sp.]|jgi:hypothetical protein|nr:hypothetical protein [Sporichthya sp.]